MLKEFKKKREGGKFFNFKEVTYRRWGGNSLKLQGTSSADDEEEFYTGKVPNIKWPLGKVVHSQKAKGTGIAEHLVSSYSERCE